MLAIGTLGTATAVLLNEHLQFNATKALEQRYLQAARQGVIDLTTISAATADGDVARVLERSTGTFRDQFEERSEDFVAVAQQADVKATGSISEAKSKVPTATQREYSSRRRRVSPIRREHRRSRECGVFASPSRTAAGRF